MKNYTHAIIVYLLTYSMHHLILCESFAKKIVRADSPIFILPLPVYPPSSFEITGQEQMDDSAGNEFRLLPIIPAQHSSKNPDTTHFVKKESEERISDA